jgi:hypothetical protein
VPWCFQHCPGFFFNVDNDQIKEPISQIAFGGYQKKA